MPTINRYQKDTISGQCWELQIIENENNTFELWELHSRKKDFKVIKEVSRKISKIDAEKYKVKNANFLIERYESL